MRRKISSIINAVAPISEKAQAKIIDLIRYEIVKKGDLLAEVGQWNNLEYFVMEGIFKTYLDTPEGESVSISFFMPESIISPSTTRNNAGKSIINIKALSNGEIATMDAMAFEKLMIEDVEIREFGNAVLRSELMAKVQKEIALASLKGKDKLHFLRKNYPNIENCIPHSDIASYLGITPISLSRLRTES
ncbi:Crp/Fnr family transcriptional regulator [Saccharicrinis aurantiacus]|uniref:Crp/Fnr family transcriptional regulator n=1 Tax=Saccharicrinis aurantiacus TaxID=1849719 RepID=UPI000838FD68|nr:Crp/Fnr family transcriptional regulator [Saccharicrinis aurantiacus]